MNTKPPRPQPSGPPPQHSVFRTSDAVPPSSPAHSLTELPESPQTPRGPQGSACSRAERQHDLSLHLTNRSRPAFPPSNGKTRHTSVSGWEQRAGSSEPSEAGAWDGEQTVRSEGPGPVSDRASEACQTWRDESHRSLRGARP